MSERPHDLDVPADEDSASRLLHMAASRPGVPADRADRVRTSVHAEWQAALHRRRARRRVGALTLAAVVALGIALKTTRNGAPAPTVPVVATVERVDSLVLRFGNNERTSSTRGELRRDDRVTQGDVLDTGASGRVALRLPDGTSLRLDAGSRARLLSPAILELTAGAVYVDSGSRGRGMEVRTERGTARDVGTQFEVRIAGASLRVRVRSGLVEVHHADRSLQARAGTELMLVDGHATNRPLRGYGPDWDWAATVGPGLDIEGRALATFLDQLSREHGWTLRYADDDLARRASTIILHGSVHGLEAMEALETALGASGLEHRLNGGDLEVYRGSSSR